MKKNTNSPTQPTSVTALIRARIEQSGERLWRMEDFRDQPLVAVAQALSRLTKAGVIQRLSKGIYYRPRATTFGQSLPNPAHLKILVSSKVFPSGVIAANLLGFTTQIAKRGEIATSAASLPRKLIGDDMIIHTHRPAAWSKLTETEAALLDFMRSGGRESDLSPEETTQQLMNLLAKRGRFKRLAQIASTEPPRVRALLGALGEKLNADPILIAGLRQSLNPLSRFDFGLFARLENAKAWQAKEIKQ